MTTFSVIIPVKTKRDLCPELLPALASQILPPLEILIITDKLCPRDPATKRDFGAKKARGSILAFIDADAYPSPTWLSTAQKLLSPSKLAAVCGPGLTSPTDSHLQQLSGLFWSSKLGAGPYLYRSLPLSPRFVDDYPTFNLLIKKTAFRKAGGFDTTDWPGEDTKICLELTHSLKKQILYHPDLLVYHHRRKILLPHLRQLSRYGQQRGRFVHLYPATSRRLSYFLPLIFLIPLPLTFPLYILSLLILWFPLNFSLCRHLPRFIYQIIFYLPTLALSHLTYSLFFLYGLLSK